MSKTFHALTLAIATAFAVSPTPGAAQDKDSQGSFEQGSQAGAWHDDGKGGDADDRDHRMPSQVSLNESEDREVSVGSTAVSAVPEPQTYVLLLGGLIMVGVLARRRRGS